MEMSNKEEDQINSSPGFRFQPTDNELLTYYLSKKTKNAKFSARAIAEVDILKIQPWDLPSNAKMGDYEWYFFCKRISKYQDGSKAIRATEAGYWKSSGRDQEIYRGISLIGTMKTLVFYKGRPRRERTGWVMHEYRLDGDLSVHNSSRPGDDEWVICRVFEKPSRGKKTYISDIEKPTTPLHDSSYSALTDADQYFDYNRFKAEHRARRQLGRPVRS
ncbi:hypothetical protein QN277_025385 [Acacia crassicarpa]|uniref:NAC domain-containing protein n=1 Tax=Acacia crassicarpa TaxID=499986 RepID=A0AAE1MKW6_9FABA|nr:hypothetical protein QN277_025385 [Acacia crassicarpa]